MKLKIKYSLVLFMLAFFVIVSICEARQFELISKNGLRSTQYICLSSEQVGDVLYLGTQRGLFQKEGTGTSRWKWVDGLPSGRLSVNQILKLNGLVQYAATDKGLYKIDKTDRVGSNVFLRSNDNENYCLSVAVLDNGTIAIATLGGLFFGDGIESEYIWRKSNTSFDEEPLAWICASGNTLFLATSVSIYKSEDMGRRWGKVFSVYSRPGAVNEDDNKRKSLYADSAIRHIVGHPRNPLMVYAASNQGVFITKNGGKDWSRMPVEGLDYANLRFIYFDEVDSRLFAVAKNGVYGFKDNGWGLFAQSYDCMQVTRVSDRLILATSKDLYSYSLNEDEEGVAGEGLLEETRISDEELSKIVQNEPTISDVQRMAIAYAEVSDEKINRWRKRANWKAVIPRVVVGYDNNVYGTYNGIFAEGPNSWDLAVSWDLSELIYNPDQTSIDTRSRLMVQLRNDILAEVTNLYFERRRLQVELFSNKQINVESKLEKSIRLQELTALINRLTGGNFV